LQYYDIIGDIHGHADALEKLLIKLGYGVAKGVYQHKKHKVIFLGDFIDRGPQQREVIEIVKPMVEQGHALSVMGNHEFNAICYAMSEKGGRVLREHSDKNTAQHQAFLDAYPVAVERSTIIDWFKTLPVYIETSGIRVIHASWNEKALACLAPLLNDNKCLQNEGYSQCSKKGSDAYSAIETLLKGPEAQLPEGVSFKDKDGHDRDKARIKWWESSSKEIKERLHLGSGLINEHKLGQTQIDSSHYYPLVEKPIFVGHYWLNEKSPKLLSENSACLDYSVAKAGKLMAYSWRGEQKLKEKYFVW